MATVLQVLPALESGGVEKGTLEIARALVAAGHRSLVVSNGGRLVAQLEREGSHHIALPIGRKRLSTLRLSKTLQTLWRDENVDLVHVRSRMPGWVVWRAWNALPPVQRPRLVTTVHGYYTPGWYSSVMVRGERVICVSESVKRHIQKHFDVESSRVEVIHRGVDTTEYPAGDVAPQTWRQEFCRSLGINTQSRRIITLPARLTRWKGQETFIDLIDRLRPAHPDILGLMVGGFDPRKHRYVRRLNDNIVKRGLTEHVKILGQRNDLRQIMTISEIVLSLSNEPEAFGRTTLEALALGRPLVGFDHGGVAEQLAACRRGWPVPPTDIAALEATVNAVLNHQSSGPSSTTEATHFTSTINGSTPSALPDVFTLAHMQKQTLDLYDRLLQGDR
ncbi:MAG: glycosyltransferase family 4 protein [Thioalkalivibrionaceae bacterium]